MTQEEGGATITWMPRTPDPMQTGFWDDAGLWIDSGSWNETPIWTDVAAGDRSE